jgi:hypothetical protein
MPASRPWFALFEKFTFAWVANMVAGGTDGLVATTDDVT